MTRVVWLWPETGWGHVGEKVPDENTFMSACGKPGRVFGNVEGYVTCVACRASLGDHRASRSTTGRDGLIHEERPVAQVRGAADVVKIHTLKWHAACGCDGWGLDEESVPDKPVDCLACLAARKAS